MSDKPAEDRSTAVQPVTGPELAGMLTLPGHPAYPDAGHNCGCGGCLALPARRPVVISLADGETREAARDEFGSYACPFCGGVTPSPEGWAANEASLVGYHAEEEGDSYEPRPYTAWDARAHQAGGCTNPACLANMDAERLAAWRTRQAEAAAEHERQHRLSASLAESAQRAEAERDRKWARLRTQAEAAGQCTACLRASYWESRPKLVRHRHPANCPVARKYAARTLRAGRHPGLRNERLR
jgi:hypothetical protein